MHSAYKKWILNSYDRINSDYVELDKLDQLVGDGDHGSTIYKGITVAKQLYLNNLTSPLDETMAIISKQMRIEMGGASGILMSIFFDESGKIDKFGLPKFGLRYVSQVLCLIPSMVLNGIGPIPVESGSL